MKKHSCYSCGKHLSQGKLRYVLKMEIYAAPELMVDEKDVKKDINREIKRLIKETEGMSEQELLEQVYIAFKFELCKRCRDVFVKRVTHKEFV